MWTNTTNILAYDCFTSPKAQKIETDKTSYEDNKTPYCMIIWSGIDLEAILKCSFEVRSVTEEILHAFCY
jgi:hypothetical protein